MFCIAIVFMDPIGAAAIVLSIVLWIYILTIFFDFIDCRIMMLLAW